MRKAQFTGHQIITVLKSVEAGRTVKDVCRETGISEASYYTPDIRKAIYTTDAIESLNSVIRAAIKKRKVFPTDDPVRKVIYLAIKDASKNGVCRSGTGGWR
jgi:transposase-like protein